MALMKRIFLFSIVNILVVLTLSISLQVITRFMGVELTGMGGLLVLYSVIGMGGAFFSLWTSKFMAKKFMGVQLITPTSATGYEKKLVDMVYRMSNQAGLKTMPEVGIYDSPEVNAFATGPSKNNSLVAVSTGLIHRLNEDQVEGVVGHEVAHIANGDMVTLTLIQGIINTVVLLVSRILSTIVANALSGDRDNPSWALQFGLYIAFQMVLGILGAVVVNFFSRQREFRADIGGAKYASPQKMISALEALSGTQDYISKDEQAFASMKISGKTGSALAALLSTHPPIETRIQRLKAGVY